MEWFSQHLWATWLGIALLLGAAELFTGDLILLMLASGALAGVATALVLPGAFVIQIVVALIVAVATMFLLRPALLSPDAQQQGLPQLGRTGRRRRGRGDPRGDPPVW